MTLLLDVRKIKYMHVARTSPLVLVRNWNNHNYSSLIVNILFILQCEPLPCAFTMTLGKLSAAKSSPECIEIVSLPSVFALALGKKFSLPSVTHAKRTEHYLFLLFNRVQRTPLKQTSQASHMYYNKHHR